MQDIISIDGHRCHLYLQLISYRKIRNINTDMLNQWFEKKLKIYITNPSGLFLKIQPKRLITFKKLKFES